MQLGPTEGVVFLRKTSRFYPTVFQSYAGQKITAEAVFYGYVGFLFYSRVTLDGTMAKD